jgi:cysteinyl-tRNA synthetase
LWEAEDQIVNWSIVIDDIIEPLNTPELQLSSDGPDPEVVEALCDDLNTHLALTVLWRLAKEIRSDAEKLGTFYSSLKLMGLVPERPANLRLDNEQRRDLIERVTELVDTRSAARQVKNFKESDRIRDELAKMGVELEDHKDGTTTWKLKRAA